MEGLSLSFNRISGTIPSQLGELTNLKSLSLRDNYLISGTLPTQLGKLTSISTRMMLNGNKISGTLSPWLAPVR